METQKNRQGRKMENPHTNYRKFFFQPMHPGIRLFRTWQFQLSIIVPSVLAAIFFFWISLVENLKFEISSEAIRNLWAYHKLSLTLLGLTFPLTALVASHHRSVQASEQIRQQQSQNLLTNHFAHTDEFVRVWEELELPPQRQLRMSMRAIHARLYPGSLEGDFSIARTFSDFLNVFINQYASLLEELADRGGLPNVAETLNELNQAFSEQTGIVLSFPAHEGESKPFSTASSATKSVISTIDKLIEAASFLPPYDIRSLKSNLEFLEARRRGDCDRPAQHEQRLNSISSSIEGLLESLGEGNVGNQPNIEQIRTLFDELVGSGDYSDEEIQYWFPWRTAQRRGMHLPDDLNGWIMRHAPQ